MVKKIMLSLLKKIKVGKYCLRIYITTLLFEWNKISETIEYASKLVNQQHDKIL